MGDCTKHFDYEEFTVSDSHPELARQIVLTEHDRHKIFLLATTILEPTREFIAFPMGITSGKRSRAILTALIAAGYPASETSDHLFEGFSAASDFSTTPDKREDAFAFIRNRLPFAFGQLIGYRNENGALTHIHVSLPTEKHQGEVWEKSKVTGMVRLPAIIT